MHIKQIKEALGISGVMTNVGSWVHSHTTHSIHITMITPDGVEESSERHFVQLEVTLNDLFK